MQSLGELFRLFFEESSDALAAISLEEGKFYKVNPSFCMLTGYEADEISGESVSVLSSTGSQERPSRSLDREILSSPGFYNDVAMATRDGEHRYLSVKVRHVEYEGKKLALVILTDETERLLLMRDLTAKHVSLDHAYQDLAGMHDELKRTQEKMFQASKLVALGELAAGVSHELNQPLTGVRGFAQEIEDLLDEEKPDIASIKELCSDITKNADKMAGLLAHLRSFAREEKKSGDSSGNHSKAVDLATVIDSAGKLFGKQLQSKNIRIELRQEEGLHAQALPHPVEQILINLLANARDAISQAHGDKGGLIILKSYKNQEWVEIEVEDNGCGVPESLRDQIFNPFFTTKDPDQGMGLGLSLSFSMAHRFGGELSLDRSDDHGSVFKLRLPLAKEEKSEVAA